MRNVEKTFLLIVILITALVCSIAMAEPAQPEDRSIVISGTSDNSDISWVLYDDGLLEFSGTGRVPSLFEHSVIPSISETNDSYRLSVKTVVVNDGITGIEQQAFNEFSNLENVSIPDSVTVLGPRAFYKCYNLTGVEIPEGVTRIYDHTFQFCWKLKSVIIPNSVVQIGDYAFGSCEKLQNVTIPEGVTTIGEEAFTSCYDMTLVTLPKSVISISDYAFSCCESLTEVHYGGTEEDFGKIEIGVGNGELTGAHFTFTAPEDPQVFEPVTVEYSFDAETATIGQPFTVHYEIKGGSGQYEQIEYSMDEITEHCRINDDYQGGELSSASGSFKVIPGSGASIDVNVSCRDSVTGIVWSENYSKLITCNPNPTLPAYIDNISSTITLNRPFTFSYTIDDGEAIAEARVEIWVFAKNDTYPDLMLNQSLTDKTGNITYTPTVGNKLYIAVRGKDVTGNPFYAKTGRLNISSNVDTTAPDLMGDSDVNCYINMPGNGELFQGGDVWQNSQVINVWVQNAYYFANHFPGTEPVWTFRRINGQVLEIDAEPKSYGSGVYSSKYYRGELTELPVATGESVYEVTCTWGGVKTTKTITIHCIDIEWPTGLINIEDTVHTYVGAKLSFNPQIAPEGWQVPGYPQLRWGFDDEADEFSITVPTKKDQYSDPYLDINDRKDLRIMASGTYESTYLITSDRVSVGRLVTFEIDEDPDWTFMLPAGIKSIEANAFEGISAEAVYIPNGCETIGAEAFKNSSISVIFIPDTVVTIGDNALPEDVFIYTPENSPASVWALEHDFEDYQIVTKEK